MALLALLGISAFSYSELRWPDHVLVSASSENPALPRGIYLARLKRVSSCEAFNAGPESPIGFVTNGIGLSYTSEPAINDLIDLMLDKGCDLNGYNAFGFTPLHGAIIAAAPAAIDLLLSRGADVNLTVRQTESNTGKPYVGLNAIEFAKLLEATGGETNKERRGIREKLELKANKI